MPASRHAATSPHCSSNEAGGSLPSWAIYECPPRPSFTPAGFPLSATQSSSFPLGAASIEKIVVVARHDDVRLIRDSGDRLDGSRPIHRVEVDLPCQKEIVCHHGIARHHHPQAI